MSFNIDEAIKSFFRHYTDVFTSKDFSTFLSYQGEKWSLKNIRDFLENSFEVFSLGGGHFQTRAGFFTGKYFSFKPTRNEFDKKVFVPGGRCIPFVDSDILSCELKFFYKGKKLPQKVAAFPSELALDFFYLYGEEFSVRYIAEDPVNHGKMNLSNLNFTLPNEIELTSVSLAPLIKDGFSYGDRILCRLLNWDKGKIELEIDKRAENPFQTTDRDEERAKWYENLENYMLDSLDFIGPMDSIEEQLAYIFFFGGDIFTRKDCGSIEEFFMNSKKIGIQPFGVESRIWKKGEDVPAVGMWNMAFIEDSVQDSKFARCPPMSPSKNTLTQSFLLDMLFTESEDYESVMKKMYPFQEYYSDEQKKLLLLHLKSLHDILAPRYNRFEDSVIGDIRHATLELYAIINEFVVLIDIEGKDLKAYPQQSLVVLSQLYAHVMHLIDALANDPNPLKEELDEIGFSLEVMRFDFECAAEELKEAMAKESRNGFKIIKR